MYVRNNRVNMVTCKIDQIECIKQTFVPFSLKKPFITYFMLQVLILLI